MEVYAEIRQKVQVNPKDVIEKLIQKEIGWNNWTIEEEGKFYLLSEQSAGQHSFNAKEEITEEKYRYVEALQLVLKRLG